MPTEKQTIDEMAARLGELVRRASRAFRIPGRDPELSPVQMVVLGHLEDSSQSVGKLADLCGAAQNTMSEIVQRLQRRGLVEKRRSQSDQRVVLVGVTKKGRQVFAKHRTMLTKVHEQVLQNLSAEQRETLLESISTVVSLVETASNNTRKKSAE